MLSTSPTCAGPRNGPPSSNKGIDTVLDAMDVVGLQQDLPAFYRALERRFGWSLGDVLRVNTTEASPPVDAFVERIRRDNALDLELYRYAVDLVRARERAAAG